MRYSKETKRDARAWPLGRSDHQRFFRRAMAASRTNDADLALLLVGGSDHRSLALRRAQALLRFDRRPSLWSHAALLFALDPKQPGRSRGVEVTLDPIDQAKQVPERNGVTEFELARYFDRRKYPNIAFVHARFPATADAAKTRAKDSKSSILDRLAKPLADSERYPLWNSLAVWARYAYTPELVPNPLLDNVVMPSAALCEFGFEAAGVDLTPGASANNTCPELIWSTATHWQRSLESLVKLQAYVATGDAAATPHEALPSTLSLARLPAGPRGRAARRRK